jgi:colanic acid biosynthesis glycosyl transferase WcaI
MLPRSPSLSMMNVIVISAVFPPEPVVSSQTSSQLVNALIQKGHQVQVIVPFPSRPSGQLYDGYERKPFDTSIDEFGCKVTRCWSTISPKSSILSRFLENISFGIFSSLALLFAAKPDVIYSNSWPIFATGLTTLVAKVKGIPIIISVQDVYPDSLVIQNRLSENNLITKVLKEIDIAIAGASSHLIVISSQFSDIYKNDRNVSGSKISIIPNWLKKDSSFISVADRQDIKIDYRAKYGIPNDDFIVMYGGNIGVAAGVEMVIKAFELVAKKTDKIWLLIAGGGSQLEECQRIVQENKIPRVVFHHPWLKEETAEVLNIANLMILPTMGQQSLVSVPSKLISYMLSGKAILSTALPHSELANVVEQSNCGWHIEPEKPNFIAEEVIKISKLPTSNLLACGEAGRRYALENSTDEVCIPKVIDLIESFHHHK